MIATFLAGGCHHAQRSPLEPCESRVGIACGLLCDSPCLSASVDHIQVSAEDLTPPRTPQNPEADEVWELGLAEAISFALKNSEVVRTLTGTTVSASPSTVYDPAISETQIQTALAAFDTSLAASMFWARDDKPPGVTFSGIPFPSLKDTANFKSSLTKPLLTGGQASVEFNTDYLLIPSDRARRFILDPATGAIISVPTGPVVQYSPNVVFSLKQPLLKGAGVDYNGASIVIARLQADQSLWDFKRDMLSLVRSVEEVYWNLWAAHGALRAAEEVIPLAAEIVRVRQTEHEFQKASLDVVGEAQTRLAEFRQERVAALAAVLEREAALRNLLGLPPSDGRRIVPADEPLRVPIQTDWTATVSAALEHRPEVVRQRLAVRISELTLLRANNGLKPQLDVEGLWRINGLDHELDKAIGILTDNQFTDWQIGLTLSVPLGFRQAAAEVQAAELQLDKERANLRQSVHATVHRLNDIVRDLDNYYQQYLAAEERLKSSRQWATVSAIRAERELAAELSTAQTTYLLGLQALVNAGIGASRQLANYNTALAQFEEAKGTLLTANNIYLAEDPCAQVRFGKVRLPAVKPAQPTE